MQLLALPLVLSAVAADPAAASAVLLPAEPDADFRVGAPIQLELEVTHRRGADVVVPGELPWPEDWAERTRSRAPAESAPGGGPAVVERFRLEVIPFAAGRFSLGPFDVEVDGETVRTDPLRLEVRSILPPEVQAALTASTALPPGQLESLTAPDPEPALVFGWNLPLISGVAGGIVGLVALALIVRWWRRRSAMKPTTPAAPPRPADAQALDDLRALGERTPRDLGGINPYYTELSRIFRRYLGRQFRFDASELTLDELDDALIRLRLPERDRQSIRALLEQADYAKFARWEPGDDDARAAVGVAVELVEQTRGRAGAIGADRGLQVAASFPEDAEARAEEAP